MPDRLRACTHEQGEDFLWPFNDRNAGRYVARSVTKEGGREGAVVVVAPGSDFNETDLALASIRTESRLQFGPRHVHFGNHYKGYIQFMVVSFDF